MSEVTEYDICIKLDELIDMANDNVSYSDGRLLDERFSGKWLNEIRENSTDFVNFVARVVGSVDESRADEDLSPDFDNGFCITDHPIFDDIAIMKEWGESEWIFDGVLKDYPKYNGKYEITSYPSGYVRLFLDVEIDTAMLRHELEKSRNRMATIGKDDVKTEKTIGKGETK